MKVLCFYLPNQITKFGKEPVEIWGLTSIEQIQAISESAAYIQLRFCNAKQISAIAPSHFRFHITKDTTKEVIALLCKKPKTFFFVEEDITPQQISAMKNATKIIINKHLKSDTLNHIKNNIDPEKIVLSDSLDMKTRVFIQDKLGRIDPEIVALKNEIKNLHKKLEDAAVKSARLITANKRNRALSKKNQEERKQSVSHAASLTDQFSKEIITNNILKNELSKTNRILDLEREEKKVIQAGADEQLTISASQKRKITELENLNSKLINEIGKLNDLFQKIQQENGELKRQRIPQTIDQTLLTTNSVQAKPPGAPSSTNLESQLIPKELYDFETEENYKDHELIIDEVDEVDEVDESQSGSAKSNRQSYFDHIIQVTGESSQTPVTTFQSRSSLNFSKAESLNSSQLNNENGYQNKPDTQAIQVSLPSKSQNITFFQNTQRSDFSNNHQFFLNEIKTAKKDKNSKR